MQTMGLAGRWQARGWGLGLALLLLLGARGRALVAEGWANAGMLSWHHYLAGRTESMSPGWWQRALAWAPGNHAAWRGLGYLELARGQEQAAIAAWQHAGMAEELIQQGEIAATPQAALAWYERAVAVAPSASKPRYTLGLAQLELAQWEAARQSFARGAALAGAEGGNAGSFHYYLGWLAEQQETPAAWEEAAREYRAALASDRFFAKDERPLTYYQLAGLLRRQEQWPQARAAYEQVLARSAPSFWARYWAYLELGVIAWQVEGDVPAGEAYLQQAIASNPRPKWAYRHLGLLYEEQGRLEEALAMYGQVLARDSADAEIVARQAALQARLDQSG